MSERGMLFSAPMVRALLSGAKTQTRRVFKQATGPSLSVGMVEEEPGQAELSWLYGDGPGHDVHEATKIVRCPYGKPGDTIWVRETWAPQVDCEMSAERWRTGARHGPMPLVHYAADAPARPWITRWRPSIHMPRWASRITLRITDVRVERLQDISEADALAEGIHKPLGSQFWHADPINGTSLPGDTPQWAFRNLWIGINGADSWDANPWVWDLTFQRTTALPEGVKA